MTWLKLGKKLIGIAAVLGLFALALPLAQAETLDDVRLKVDTEYAAGNMGSEAYEMLQNQLDKVAAAANVQEYEETTLWYNGLVSMYAGPYFTPETMERLYSQFDVYAGN